MTGLESYKVVDIVDWSHDYVLKNLPGTQHYSR